MSKSPSDKVGELREIAELFWSFHNARLADPSINEMKPYIQPILDLVHQKQVEARIETAKYIDEAQKCPKDTQLVCSRHKYHTACDIWQSLEAQHLRKQT